MVWQEVLLQRVVRHKPTGLVARVARVHPHSGSIASWVEFEDGSWRPFGLEEDWEVVPAMVSGFYDGAATTVRMVVGMLGLEARKVGLEPAQAARIVAFAMVETKVQWPVTLLALDAHNALCQVTAMYGRLLAAVQADADRRIAALEAALLAMTQQRGVGSKTTPVGDSRPGEVANHALQEQEPAEVHERGGGAR